MEPLLLTLENFTSYQNETLDFGPVQLAALVGANGSGKSSLVDAILFALYGQSSKAGRQQLDAHVYPGADACRVEFSFRLNGDDYRVIRIRDRRRQKSALELFRLTHQGGDWTTMSGKNIDETQTVIESLIRMGYDDITASALILQGQSGNLTGSMTDGERRDVFDRILGLDLYERLLGLAKDNRATAAAEVGLLQRDMQDLQIQADTLSAVEQHIAKQTILLQDHDIQVNQTLSEVTALETQASQRDLLQRQAADTNKQIEDRQREQTRTNADRVEGLAEAGRLKHSLGARPGLEAELQQAQNGEHFAAGRVDGLLALVAELEAKALTEATTSDLIDDLHRQRHAKRVHMAQIAEDGKKAAQSRQSEMNIIDQAFAIRAAAARQAELIPIVAEWDDRQTQRDAAEKLQQHLHNGLRAWQSSVDGQIQVLETTLKHHQGAASTLDQVPCGDDLKPHCPLLASARKSSVEIALVQFSLAEWRIKTYPQQQALQAAEDKIEEIAYDGGAHGTGRQELREAQVLAGMLPGLEAAERRSADLEVQVREYATRYKAVEAELDDLIERSDLVKEKHQKVLGAGVELTTTKSDLDVCQRRLASIREQMASLRQAIIEADRRDDDTRQRIDKLVVKDRELSQRSDELEAQITDLQVAWAELTGQSLACQEAAELAYTKRRRLEDLRHLESTYRGDLGAMQAEAATLRGAAKKVELLGERLVDAQRRANVWAVLVRACDKKSGIPALIRENAVPQMEAIANELLAKMAGGRMQVRLDTQVAGKTTGAMQEVLRITVLEQGEARDYRTYSGAEKFMVDLGIRIALSRFLAHRSGAEIQLFVLDEGLGALDAANRLEVMAALQQTASEFAKVLVITHIPELQEALPQRIEISRTELGSKAKVIA